MWRKDPSSTRTSLLEAGALVFAERGFEGARVGDIARRARVNKAMINYHFGGKEALYRAILASTFEPALERFRALRDSKLSPPDQLREFVSAFAEMVASRPGFPAMILQEALSGGRHLDEQAVPYFLSIFSVVREIVDRGVREKAFREVDPFLTHQGLIGSLVFFFAIAPFRRRLISEGRAPLAEPAAGDFVRHIQDLMTRALATEAGIPPATGGR